MQKTITARQISYNLIALFVLLGAIAVLVGFVTGLAMGKPSSAPSTTAPVEQVQAQINSSALAQPNAPIEGWVYLHDSVTNKWYAYPATTPPGTIIDVGNVYELRNGPGNSGNGCGLDRAEPDC